MILSHGIRTDNGCEASERWSHVFYPFTHCSLIVEPFVAMDPKPSVALLDHETNLFEIIRADSNNMGISLVHG